MKKKESRDVFSSLKNKSSPGFDDIHVNLQKQVFDLVKNSLM